VRILVTNDDGVDATGLHALARALADLGDVVVAAPDREYSGAGAALGPLHLIQPEVRRARIDGIAEAWAVNGPPGLCVMFSRLGAFGPPFDLVVSGINPGANVGRAVYHSGTVGACLTGRNGGLSGVAVSQAVRGFGVEGQGWDEMLVGQHWDTAAHVARIYVTALLAALPRDPVVANLNVPNVPIDQLKGWRRTEIGMMPPRTMASATLEPITGHDDAFRLDLAWGDELTLPEGTDGGTVERDEISLTYLSRIVADERRDMDAIDSSLDGLGR
jgi:5'-nucleotidase